MENGKNISEISKFPGLREFGELHYEQNNANCSSLSTLYLAKVMTIPEFLRIFINVFFKNSKFWVWGHMGNSNTQKMIPNAAL
jgi:hypothetical protein